MTKDGIGNGGGGLKPSKSILRSIGMVPNESEVPRVRHGTTGTHTGSRSRVDYCFEITETDKGVELLLINSGRYASDLCGAVPLNHCVSLPNKEWSQG